MVGRGGGVTGGGEAVMAGRVGVAGFVVHGRFPMVVGGLLEMLGGLGVVFVRLVGGGHLDILSSRGDEPMRLGSRPKHRSAREA